MLVIAALGGNALLRRNEPVRPATQKANVETACRALVPLAAAHRLVITHGNGPQVGLLASQDSTDERFPLDVLGAETEGMIGYLVAQALDNALPGGRVVTLLTQIVVAEHDPAFAQPTKPIGAMYTEDEARSLALAHGWTIAPDGDGYRRVVPSPQPREIVELDAIKLLVDAGVIVICAGGGGIPIVRNGASRGVEAVIDKDLAAALLGERLHADFLLMLTDVPAVERNWRTPDAEPIGATTPRELRQLDFAAGSMGPKVEAACRFVEHTGGTAAIGALAEADAIVAGRTGTIVRPD